MAKKYYAIKEGKGVSNVILETWEECQRLITGYPAKYKSFKSKEQAEDYLKGIEENKSVKDSKKSKNNKRSDRKEVKVKKEVKTEIKGAGSIRKKSTRGMTEIKAYIPKALYDKFLKRCEVMKMQEERTLNSLICEVLEEWTDDI